jgi:ubiquitin C-terminal hydrolase
MRGLWNLGNTCYFNTAVQCLAHVPPLTKHLFSIPPYEGPCVITREYQKIARELFMKDKTDAVSPSDLLGAFRGRFPQFANHGQHDAQEVILLLIDVFEKSLGKELIQEIFNGEDSQETLWSEGMSTVKTPFTTLVLDVSEPCRLQDLLDDRLEEHEIEGYLDAQGKTHDVAAIRHRVTKWPRIVNFSFSMYDYKFPIEIPFEFEGRKLFACVLHQGVQRGGHYALLVRRFNKWYLKDDETVREVEPTIFKGEFYQAWYRP